MVRHLANANRRQCRTAVRAMKLAEASNLRDERGQERSPKSNTLPASVEGHQSGHRSTDHRARRSL